MLVHDCDFSHVGSCTDAYSSADESRNQGLHDCYQSALEVPDDEGLETQSACAYDAIRAQTTTLFMLGATTG